MLWEVLQKVLKKVPKEKELVVQQEFLLEVEVVVEHFLQVRQVVLQVPQDFLPPSLQNRPSCEDQTKQ